MYYVKDLINIFNACFEASYKTQLVGGAIEPLYLPADRNYPYNRIIFTQDFFSSALHECAHWFIAGDLRRQKIDYGYWYIPDGRNTIQQRAFEQVEVKPQALEWLLSSATGHAFNFSVDNLTGESIDITNFKNAVALQREHYLSYGLPPRAEIFYAELSKFYHKTK